LIEREEQDQGRPAEETTEAQTKAAPEAQAEAENAPEPTAESQPEAAPEAETAPEPTAEAQSEVAPEQPEAAPEQTEAAAPAEPDGADETPTDETPTDETPTDETPTPEPEPEPVRTLERLAADARYSATGKRKTAVARVIIRPGSGQFELNGRSLEVYFPRRVHQTVVRQPLDIVGFSDRVDVRARIHGGGISGQADAVRHGIAKALIEADPALRGELKRRQLLTRDPREKERRKAGLKKARKRPQFSKR
jgi:small subunit ribosomal protein S9